MAAVDESIPTPERETDKPFLMPVEDVFTITGRGTVITGRIERGIVKVNEEVEIIGIREVAQKSTVTGVEMFRKLLDEGQAGENVGLLLRGTKREDIERGMVVIKPGTTTPHTNFEAIVYILSKDEGGRHTPFFNNYRPAVLLPYDGRDRRRDPPRGHRDGHARRQHRRCRSSSSSPSPWTRACASPSARVAAPSAPAGSPRSPSDPRRSLTGTAPSETPSPVREAGSRVTACQRVEPARQGAPSSTGKMVPMGFARAELESFRDVEVPDLLPAAGQSLQLLFVGINPGLWTAATQTHFAHPGTGSTPHSCGPGSWTS